MLKIYTMRLLINRGEKIWVCVKDFEVTYKIYLYQDQNIYSSDS